MKKGNALIGYIVGALVVLLVASAILPTALTAFHDTNTTGWSSGETSLYSVVGILVLVGVVIGIISMAIKKNG